MNLIINRTERLIIRMPIFADVKDSFAIYSDPEVTKFLDGIKPFKSIGQAKDNIKRGVEHFKEHGVCHWAVIERESDKFVGHCGFNLFDAKGAIEIMAHIKKEFWGKGYATEASEACLIYTKEHLSFKKVVGLVEPDNKASIRLIEKLGFTSVGECTENDVKFLKYELII